jgi:hypothetical protein
MTIPDKEIEAAFYTYLKANFSACAIDYPGVEFSTKEKTEWIQPRIFAVGRKPARRGQGFSTYLVNINVFVKHGTNAYRIMEIVDLLYALFDQKDVLVPYPGPLSGLLRWYNFEGNCYDKMKLGDGTPTDVTYAASQSHFGQAGNFNGSTSKVVVAKAADINNLAELTVTALMNARSDGQGDGGKILAKTYWRFEVSLEVGGKVCIYGRVNHATTNAESLSYNLDAQKIPLNAWQPVAMTFTAADAKVRLFWKGVEMNYSYQYAGVGARVDDSAENMGIGNYATATRTFDGYLDDVRLYNRALTTAELRVIARGLPFQFTEMEHRRIPQVSAGRELGTIESLDQVNIECRFFIT